MRRWFRRLLLLLLVALAAGEISQRIVNREEEANGSYFGLGAFQSSAVVGYTHAPGFEGHAVRRGNFVSPVSINRLGLRQANLDAQRNHSSRLLVLGDSFAFGLGVDEQQTFVSLLQEPLNARGVGVINGAQSGYCVRQERLLGVTLAAEIKPNMILLSLFPFNDVQDDFDRRYDNIDVRYGYRLPKDRWLAIAPVDYLRTHSYLWMHRVHRLNIKERRRRRKAFEELAEGDLPAHVQPTLDAVNELRLYCLDQEIRLAVVLIPMRRGETVFDAPLEAALVEQGLDVLDLKGALTDADYFPTDAHWNAQGHRKAADRLGPFLTALI